MAVTACRSEPLVDVKVDLGSAVDKLAAAVERIERDRAAEAARAERQAATHEPSDGDLPPGATKAIARARAAIAARDFDKLRALLDDGGEGIASYDIGDDLKATTARAAINAWRARPALLTGLAEALAGPCEADPPEDGHVIVVCGGQRSGAPFVMLTNLDERSPGTFKIYTLNTTL